MHHGVELAGAEPVKQLMGMLKIVVHGWSHARRAARAAAPFGNMSMVRRRSVCWVTGNSTI
jgi:hypothetical protein